MILDFNTKYQTSITYYGLGFIWSNNGGKPISGGGGTQAYYRTLLGVGI